MQKQGLAKAQFLEFYQQTPWLDSFKKKSSSWDIVNEFLSQKFLRYLDYVLVHRLLQEVDNSEENVALFLCHLTLAAKEGHLCIQINDHQLTPSVNQLWQNEDGLSLSHEKASFLTQLIIEGSLGIPEKLLTILKNDVLKKTEVVTPICYQKNKFYLQKYWYYETLFIQFLSECLSHSPALELDLKATQQTLNQLRSDQILLDEQAKAIQSACAHVITLVTGGPGTGKTYTAGHLIKTFWKHLPDEYKKTCQIVLAAPTGKAASNLQKSLSQAIATLENFPVLQAKTLHALLGIKSTSTHEISRLSADLIVIDESSMIDIKMMALLFASLKPGTRLILLGDECQLPSVESGNIFADLIQLHQHYPSIQLSCIHLNTCLRVELKSLIDFAHLINTGQTQSVLNELNQHSSKGVKRLSFESDQKEKVYQTFIDHVLAYFPTIIKQNNNPDYLLNLFHQIRLLTPLRQGKWGVEHLNQVIWQKICQKLPLTGYIAIPIMITVNDYKQELFNGETGVLIRKLPLQPLSLDDYALFPSKKMTEKYRSQSALLLPKYTLAYCLTVHKSQGSEFDHVILVLPEGSDLFGRELLYTAVTRARKKIEIYSTDHTLVKTIQQKGKRLSGIIDRLNPK